MISIRNSAYYRRDCQIYEKFANFAVGEKKEKFIKMYEQFKLLVEQFDKQSFELGSTRMSYDYHKDLKDRLISHKMKMDELVKSEKHILQQIKKKKQ